MAAKKCIQSSISLSRGFQDQGTLKMMVSILELSIFVAFNHISEYDSTLYVGLARAVSPTNTNFWLTFLLTRLQDALYEDLAV